jgi:hypothetical protein
MKICLLNTYPHGGAGTACARLSKALSEQPHTEVSLLSTAQVSNWAWKANFYAERLPFIAFQAAEKSLRFSFSPANWGLRLDQHPLVQAADVLHFHFINVCFMSLNSL